MTSSHAIALTLAACLAGCSSDPAVVNITLPARTGATTSLPDMAAATTGTAGIRVAPTSGLMTTASGGKAIFTIVLLSQPSSTVTIRLSSSDPTQGTVSPSSVSFDATDWSVAKTVTVTGVDDGVVNGNHVFTIVTSAASSSDSDYSGLNPPDVTVTNVETDVAGFTITPSSGLTTTFGVATATFAVRLTTMPSASVTLGLSSSDTTQGTVSPPSLTFTPASWAMPQTVTVTGVDDQIANGNQVYTIVTAAAVSTDPSYSGLDPPDVMVTNIDTDVAGFIVSPTRGLNTSKAGAQATFTMRLTSKPVGTVSVGLSSSNTSEGSVSPSSLSFNGATWSTLQTVTVTGVNDNKVTGPIAYSIITAPASASASDAAYVGLNPPDVSLTNQDTNVAGVFVSQTSGLTTWENGTADTPGSSTFTMRLNTAPSATVTITLGTSDGTIATPSPASVAFDGTNWSTPQSVTAVGRGDASGNTAASGSLGFTIITNAATSSDPSYQGLDPPDVTGVSFDDDIEVFGGDSTGSAFMQWCNSSGACVQPLNVGVPRTGGSVNFWLVRSGDTHSVFSPTSEWTGSGPLVAKSDLNVAPFVLTLGSGDHGYFCGVHGTGMSGSIHVP